MEHNQKKTHSRFLQLQPAKEIPEKFHRFRAFLIYVERNNPKLQRLHAIMHMATSLVRYIDSDRRDTKNSLHEQNSLSKTARCGENLVPRIFREYQPKSPYLSLPDSHTISRVHLNDNEKEAGYCLFFAENLTRHALEWFAGLEIYSINKLTQLISSFLKLVSVFRRHRNRSKRGRPMES